MFKMTEIQGERMRALMDLLAEHDIGIYIGGGDLGMGITNFREGTYQMVLGFWEKLYDYINGAAEPEAMAQTLVFIYEMNKRRQVN